MSEFDSMHGGGLAPSPFECAEPSSPFPSGPVINMQTIRDAADDGDMWPYAGMWVKILHDGSLTYVLQEVVLNDGNGNRYKVEDPRTRRRPMWRRR